MPNQQDPIPMIQHTINSSVPKDNNGPKSVINGWGFLALVASLQLSE